MAAMVWTLIALMGTGLAALMVDSRSGRRVLRSELRSELAGLRADLVAAMAQTHPPSASPQG